MSDVFVSYKREDQGRVRQLVQALRAAALDVWWDVDIPPGAPWEQTIETQLGRARVVVVCWSKTSVASENVKAEARRAKQQGKLVQAFLGEADPPLFFGERQGIDLSGIAGPSRQGLALLVQAVRAHLDGSTVPNSPTATGRFGPLLRMAAGAGLVLAVGAALFFGLRLQPQPLEPQPAAFESLSSPGPAPVAAPSPVSQAGFVEGRWALLSDPSCSAQLQIALSDQRLAMTSFAGTGQAVRQEEEVVGDIGGWLRLADSSGPLELRVDGDILRVRLAADLSSETQYRRCP